jgi:imidazolonepropionase-like amidohydrolase
LTIFTYFAILIKIRKKSSSKSVLIGGGDMAVLAITNGNVFTITASWLSDAVLVARDGIIEAVGSSKTIDIPQDAEIIDARGRYIIPGLIDAHNHLGIDGDEVKQLQEPDDVTMIRCLKNAKAQVMDGVTTLRDMGEKNGIDFHLRELFANGKALGPRLLCAGRWITTPHGHCAYPQMLVVSAIDEVRRAVRKNIDAGADVIKLMVSGGISSPTTFPTESYWSRADIGAAVEEAHDASLPIAAHCFGGQGLHDCLESGVDTIEHGGYILSDEDLEALKRADKILVYTLAFFPRGLRTDALVTDWPEAIKKRMADSFNTVKESIKRTARAGLRIAVGSDTVHEDHALAEGMELLVECGFSQRDVLLAATQGSAQACFMTESIGALEVGKLADIVILEDDPFEDIRALRRVWGVIKNGERVK